MPSCPAQVAVNASSNGSIEVMWEEVEGGGEPITEYTLVAVGGDVAGASGHPFL